jgi:hypothetical protein
VTEESTLRPWIEDGKLKGSVETKEDEVVLEILVDLPDFGAARRRSGPGVCP